MPKVIGYTPGWLSRPSAGARIFADPSPQSPASPSKRPTQSSPTNSDYQGPKRLIARRGTEIFTAVGNQIRWTDLVKVKDDWEDNHNYKQKNDQEHSAAYRTLATPVYYQIRQLVISPSGYFLAICTEHTVHIAFLPDYARLADQTGSALKLTTRQLGPITHVIPESPLASVIWHPLASAGPSSDCLVTVTSEAAVRVWELEKSNKWSFERPALAIDLRKLADGVSCDQDFEPSGFGKNRGFSVDDFDMEVASACFGGQGLDDEDAWASMTLWTAMKNGDIYAMCPLLPSKWQPTSTTIPSLSTSAISRMATVTSEDADPTERRAADQQYEWVQEIDDDEPVDASTLESVQETRLRPQNPSAIPRLQGPFEVFLDDEEADLDVTDILVYPARLDENELFSGEDDYNQDERSAIPFTTITLACSDGALYVALDLEGVSGQWLPKRGRSTFSLPTAGTRELDLVTSMTLMGNSAGLAYLSFSPDPVHRYGAFVSTTSHVYALSLDEWITSIAVDMSADEEIGPGLRTRLDASSHTQVGRLEEISLSDKHPIEGLSAPIVIEDVDLGYFLLSSTSSAAVAVSFDQPHLSSSVGPSTDFARSQMQHMRIERIEPDTSDPLPSRQIYAPPNIFYHSPELSIMQLKNALPHPQKRIIIEQPMRLSPAMLNVMTATHRIVSRQTAELERAAAELFRRCERLREELGDQVKQMSELADRLHHLQGNDGDDVRSGEKRKTPDERIQAANEKQLELMKRYEALRRKVGKVGTAKKELSAKEIAWRDEVEVLSRNAGVEVEDGEVADEEVALKTRYQTVEEISRKLLEASKRLQSQTEDLTKSTSTVNEGLRLSDSNISQRSSRSSLFVSSRYQREKVAEAMQMVEREGAVIDAVMGRLESLTLQV